MVISENCCNFKVLKIKSLQTIIAMITEDKVTEIFCIADDFCKVFDAQMGKYTIKSNTKRRYHREFTMTRAEIMVIIIVELQKTIAIPLAISIKKVLWENVPVLVS